MTMDINYPSPLNGSLETIFITLLYRPVPRGHNSMQIVAYERRSTYSVYRACGDGPSTESICICQKEKKYKFNVAQNWLTHSQSSQVIDKQESHQLSACIFIVQRFVGFKGASLYAVNICKDQHFQLKLRIKTVMSYSTNPKSGWFLKSYDVQFILVYRVEDSLPLSSLLKFSLEVV